MVITTTAKATATSTTTTINYYNINVVADVVVQLLRLAAHVQRAQSFSKRLTFNVQRRHVIETKLKRQP